MFVVVGSGHAGVSCAVSLVEAGMPVTLIDGGIQLEPQTREVVARMASTPADRWSPEDLAVVKSNVSASSKGVQIKKVFGSDFPFRAVDQVLPRTSSDIGHLTPTLATAGFSNVWGAAALPYSTNDLKGWPVTVQDLEPFYKSVCRFMPLTGSRDGLEELFAVHTESPTSLKPSKQAQSILTSLKRREVTLRSKGIIFGTPRLAVRGQVHERTEGGKAGNSQGCSYCGLCLFGCPYDHIYSTNDTLRYLKTFPHFTHMPGVVVDSFSEGTGDVLVMGRSLVDNKPVTIAGTKLFLAAGVLSTTRILLKSMSLYDEPIRLPTSEYFMLPVLSLRKTPSVRSEALHTLSQIFVECIDPQISEHSSHMQLYTYSELFKLGLYETFGPLKPLLKAIEPEVLGRLNVIQGYLHSQHSSHIDLSLTRKDGAEVLEMKGVANPLASKTIKRLVAKLTRSLLPSGLVPVRPMLNIGKPGEGRHVGGAFPMSASPSERECDVFGRPPGFRNVHVVDATVFPTVPAATITFTAMANAQRIASHVVTESGGS